MAENKGLGLPQTKGSFQIRGSVFGTKRDSFYNEKLTKTNKQFRQVFFSLQFDKDMSANIDLSGMEKDYVYFSKKDGNNETIVEKVAWKDRGIFNKEGYQLIGVNLGITKIKDSKGNDVNDKKRLIEFDACKEISENLIDGQTVFTRGEVEYSTYNGKHRVRFVPSQISLAKDIDFDTEDFKPTANFTQVIVFMGIKLNDDKTKAIVDAKIINYNSIEDAEFIITDMNLANLFRKNLKPYTSIKVWGDITAQKDTTQMEVSSGWGTTNVMDRVNTPTIRELVITGADPESIDTTTYSESEIDRAIETMKANNAAEKDFGESSDGWGTSLEDDDETEDGWG